MPPSLSLNWNEVAIRNGTCVAFGRAIPFASNSELTFDFKVSNLLQHRSVVSFATKSEDPSPYFGTDNMTDWTANSNEALHLSLGISSRVSELSMSSRCTTQYAPLQMGRCWVITSRTRTSIRLSLIRSARIPLEFLSTISLTLIQIYGEDEKIYGYTDLVIDVRFTCL